MIYRGHAIRGGGHSMAPQFQSQCMAKVKVNVWGCCSTTYINRLQKLQNRAVRMINNSAFDTPAKPLLANLGLRLISELNENELKLITYKSLNDLAPNYLRQLLIRNSQQSCRALRNTDRDLKLPLKKLIMGKKDILSE